MGGIAVRRPIPTDDTTDDDYSDYDYSDYSYIKSSDSQFASESDDDHETKLGGSKDTHIAKRAKTGKIAASAERSGFSRKSVANLSGIIDMPLDVLFEIFKHVTPKDLLNLSRTSKVLRDTLLSKRAITIWTASMKIMEAPPCPNDCPVPKWANLLFGGNNCQSCGARGVSRLDFGLRRRMCLRCAKTYLVSQTKFRQKFPTYDALIMDLLPYTNLGGWSSRSGSSNRFFFPDDVHAVAKEFKKLDENVKKGIPGAQQAFESFLKARIETVVQSLISTRASSPWAADTAKKQRDERHERKSARLIAVKAKLLELGYLEKDMAQLSTLSVVDKDTELTDLSWARSRKAIEDHVQSIRASRLIMERESLIASRKRIIAKMYSDYKKALVPTQWAYHPPLEALYELDGLARLIDDPIDSEIDIEVWTHAFNQLPAFVESLNEQKKAILLSLLPVVDGRTACNEESLNLATAIFQCTTSTCDHRNKPFIGWQCALCHSCHDYRLKPAEPVYQFSRQGASIVRAIGGLLGLNMTRATPQDFDLKAARFLCLTCLPCKASNLFGRQALTWREAVAHSLEMVSHPVKWQILNHEQTTEVKLREQNAFDFAHNQPRWSCIHCAEFFENFRRFDQVTKHVQDKHAISNPTEGRDLFFDPRYPRGARSVLLVGERVSSEKDYICRQCKGGEQDRKFILGGVISHLKSKHKVLNPVLRNDYALSPASN